MTLTDSHCHLDFDNFSKDREYLLKQCYQLGIQRIIIPTISPNNWDKVLKLSTQTISTCSTINKTEKSTRLFACLGIHPWFLNSLNDGDLNNLSRKIEENATNIVAIGETGIDKVIAEEQGNMNKQIAFFEHQLHLSQQYNLPVIVHHRRSHEIIIPLLKKFKLNRCGVIHGFSGSYQQAKSYVDLGFKLGIGGTITYERAQKTIKAIKKLPLQSLVLETDAPSMPLQGFQGQDNSPVQLVNILNCLSDIRSESLEDITQTIESNIDDLFFDR